MTNGNSMYFANLLTITLFLFSFNNNNNVSGEIIDRSAIATMSNFPSKNLTLQYEIMNKLQNFTTSFTNANLQQIPDVNGECLTELSLYFSGLLKYGWAFKMLDATAKLQSGLAEGNIYNLGSFDECLSIRNEKVVDIDSTEDIFISGQYCLGTLIIPVSNAIFPLIFGVCIPSACSASDINTVMASIQMPLFLDDKMCQVYKESVDLDGGDIAVIVFLSIIGIITTLSTAYDVYLQHNEKTLEGINKNLISFSLWTNGKKLFSTSRNSDQLECLSGLRTISMMWIVYSHSFSLVPMAPLSNMAYLLTFFEDGWTMHIRGATVSVDTFFLMSGIVLIYVYLKSTKEDQVWFNVFQYYFHRYIRLTPALAVLILVQLTIVRHFGSGPMRPLIGEMNTGWCQENWWTNLLYIQNFVNRKEMCLAHTWYLAVDMQLFLLSPLILIPIRRWKKITLELVVAAIGASLTSSFLMAWFMELRNSVPITEMAEQSQSYGYMQYYYLATYNRASPYLIGILAGYFIYHVKFVKKSFKISRILNIILWMCSLAVLGVCVFYDNQYDDRIAMSFHVAFVRPAWAIAVAWIVIACVTGYGGPVNGFLSLPIFQILGRLTYSLYLVHITILNLVYASTKSSIVLSNVLVMYDFWSVYMVSVGVAIIWTLLFESPIIMLEKSLNSPRKSGK